MSKQSAPSPTRRVFRLPLVALLVPLALLFLVAPLAFSGGWLWLMLSVPVLGLSWVLLTRTVATTTGVTVTGLLGRRRLGWDGLQLLRNEHRWVLAIEPGGRRTRLPMVTAADLPELLALSTGRATVSLV